MAIHSILLISRAILQEMLMSSITSLQFEGLMFCHWHAINFHFIQVWKSWRVELLCTKINLCPNVTKKAKTKLILSNKSLLSICRCFNIYKAVCEARYFCALSASSGMGHFSEKRHFGRTIFRKSEKMSFLIDNFSAIWHQSPDALPSSCIYGWRYAGSFGLSP